MTVTNRSLEERNIVYKINILKKRQYDYRKRYLDCDAKISFLVGKLNNLVDKRMKKSKRRVKRRGDGYAC